VAEFSCSLFHFDIRYSLFDIRYSLFDIDLIEIKDWERKTGKIEYRMNNIEVKRKTRRGTTRNNNPAPHVTLSLSTQKLESFLLYGSGFANK
jgi:hypothetical protein